MSVTIRPAVVLARRFSHRQTVELDGKRPLHPPARNIRSEFVVLILKGRFMRYILWTLLIGVVMGSVNNAQSRTH